MIRRAGTPLAVAVLCVSGLLLAACDLLVRPQPEAEGGIPAASEEWDRNVRSFVDATLEARPHFAVVQGRHEYDGRLADYSEQGLRQWLETLRDERRKAVGFVRASLSREQEFERSNLLTQIDRELFRLETARHPWTSASYYLEGLDPVVYVAREYAPAADRLRAYVRFAENVPEAARQISVNLRGPLARVQLEAGAKTFRALANFVARDAAHTFSGVGEPELQASFLRVNEPARAALDALADSLSSRTLSAPESGFALGRHVLLEMLWRTERLVVGLEELKKAAEQELERASAALARVCNAALPEGSIPDCTRQLRSPRDDWNRLAAGRRQVGELERRLRAAGVVTVPSETALQVREVFPNRGHEVARLEGAGSYEAGLDAVYRLAVPASLEVADAGVFPSEADLWLLSAHEVFPGRLVQHLHSNRSPTEAARLFVGRGFSAGWAHYAEQMAFEGGVLPDDPAIEAAYLLSTMLRAVRMLSVIALHAEASTLAEAEEMFRRDALLSDERARAEASLAAVDPERLHDTLGRLLILRLREDWFFEQGEAASARVFHDRFLSFGGPPIMAVRGMMVGNTGGSPL